MFQQLGTYSIILLHTFKEVESHTRTIRKVKCWLSGAYRRGSGENIPRLAFSIKFSQKVQIYVNVSQIVPPFQGGQTFVV